MNERRTTSTTRPSAPATEQTRYTGRYGMTARRLHRASIVRRSSFDERSRAFRAGGAAGTARRRFRAAFTAGDVPPPRLADRRCVSQLRCPSPNGRRFSTPGVSLLSTRLGAAEGRKTRRTARYARTMRPPRLRLRLCSAIRSPSDAQRPRSARPAAKPSQTQLRRARAQRTTAASRASAFDRPPARPPAGRPAAPLSPGGSSPLCRACSIEGRRGSSWVSAGHRLPGRSSMGAREYI